MPDQADDNDDKKAWDRYNIDDEAAAHGSGGVGVEAGGGEARSNPVPFTREVQDPTHRRGHQYGNITIGGSAPVQIGDVIYYYSPTTLPRADTPERPVRPARASFTGTYAHSSLQPVATYVPRLELERRLHEQLALLPDSHNHEMRTAVVWGLGGAGKSQLVLDFIRKHRQQYQRLFWIEAGQKQTLERDFIQIHKLLFPNLAQNDRTVSVEDAVTAVKSWFHGQEGRSLWVMDSADVIDDEEDPFYIDVDHYLPNASGLDIIITTRSSRAQSMSSQEAVAVAEMSVDEAALLFRTCAKLRQPTDETNQTVLAIVQELGCLALAVTLAGAYVTETPRLSSDVRRYLPEYRAHRKRLLSRKAQRNAHRYSDSVLSTWEMSFAAIERQSMVAARLLSLLAFLNFDDISSRLFESISDSMSPDDNLGDLECARWLRLLSPEGAVVNEYGIEAGFATLRAYSLVSWRADQEAYAIHKMVHAWAHDRLDIEQRRIWSLAVMHLLSVVISSDEENLFWHTRMVPHVVANFSAMSAACGLPYQTTDSERDALSTLGRLLKRLGRWDDEYGVRLFLKKATTAALGLKHPDTLTSMNNLALVLWRQGKYKQAEEMHGQTLELRKTVLGLEHPDTLTSMDNLATVLSDQGKYKQAEEMHRQELKLSWEVLGLEHPDTLTSMGNLATVLSDQGKYEQAEEMHRQELKLRKTVLGLEHPSTLTSMGNLATVLSDQGKYEQAEEMHRQELKLSSEVLGLEHPDTLMSMDNLATVLSDQGKYGQAEEMHGQTLELRKTVLGLEHPHTLTSMNNLATVLSDQGKYKQAEEMHGQTLELKKTVLGLEHPDTLTSMNNLATVLSDQGKYKQAEEMYGQTLDLRKTVLGLEHPDTLTSMNNLATVLSDQGKYEQAEEMYGQTLDLRKTVLGLKHPYTLTSMGNLATVLSDQGKYEQAEEMHRQELKFSSEVLGLEHPDTLTSMGNLALVLSRQGKYKQAGEMHGQTLELRKTVLGLEHPDTLTSINNLARVLRDQGKHEEAKALYIF